MLLITQVSHFVNPQCETLNMLKMGKIKDTMRYVSNHASPKGFLLFTDMLIYEWRQNIFIVLWHDLLLSAVSCSGQQKRAPPR